MRRFFVGLLILVSALTLIASSTSLWTRRHIVNTDVFVAGSEKILADPAVQATLQTRLVDTIMATPTVQQAIDQTVATLPPRLQAFRPSIEEGTRNLLGKGVQTILTSAAFATLTTAVLRNAQTDLINGQPVALTVGEAKALVPPENRTGLAGQVLNLIPDDVGITVLTKEQAPQVYTSIDLLRSLWLWAGLISLAALVGALVLSRRRRSTLRAWAVTTGVLGLVLVLALAVLRGPLLAQVKPANVDAADAIYQGVTASLRSWTLWLVLIMAGITVITLLWGRIGIIPALRRGYRATRARAARHREQRAIAKIDGKPAPEQSWPRRFAADTREFVRGLNLPEQFETLGTFLRNHLRMARWTGIVLGALVLLFWPSPTVSVLIWVAAAVALYLGLLELILAVAARAQPAIMAPEPRVPAAEAPHVPAPRVHHSVTPEDLSVLGSRLDLLMRLGDARTAGVLTEEEFAREKAELLDR
ncbi:MAG TPA: SHOCT domain-containing protein [Amycolatopsis sp.]|uniref:SHOCT domain-containing protein n=1 Tax=Amycolatopsis sp. TaxID=37632 RepID=UPI002B4A8E51|nr:SHOCT domain-containing protein [Amycolatopsis sp.]HKS47295.1 SHOCT domain-containing protein [Amycolatopsis sp.]